MQQIEESIERYLWRLDRADRSGARSREARTSPAQGEDRRACADAMQPEGDRAAAAAGPDQQLSLTDPDARSMATSGRGTGIVGYNVQTAVDAKPWSAP